MGQLDHSTKILRGIEPISFQNILSDPLRSCQTLISDRGVMSRGCIGETIQGTLLSRGDLLSRRSRGVKILQGPLLKGNFCSRFLVEDSSTNWNALFIECVRGQNIVKTLFSPFMIHSSGNLLKLLATMVFLFFFIQDFYFNISMVLLVIRQYSLVQPKF